jgi:magnesium transporter
MDTAVDNLDLDDLRAILRAEDADVQAFLRLVSHPADIAEALDAVKPEEWPRILRLVDDDEVRAEIVALLDESETEALVEYLSPSEVADLATEMESDDAADLVGELDPEEQKQALEQMPAEERAEVEQLLRYPEDSAGGIMQVEFAQVQSSDTVAQTIEKVRELDEDGVEIHRIYVTDDQQRLSGSIDLVSLLFHDAVEPVAKFVEPLLATVTPLVDQEEVAHLFGKYDLITLPVVDDDGIMLGRIVHDDIVDVLEEEAEEDALRMAGTDAEELLYRDKALSIARVRLPWLAINLVGLLGASVLLKRYGVALEEVWVIVSIFLPAIMAMGGNVGTQSATIIIRGIATGRVVEGDVRRTVFRELRVGLIMGLVCGLGTGGVAMVMGGGQLALGFVVGLGMMAAMTAASVLGSMTPALMKRAGIDPAIASGPLVTTTNDVFGILIYLTTALIFLEHLKGGS